MSISLSQEFKSFGEQLLRELDKTLDKPTSMLWTDTVSQGEWVLVIAPISITEQNADPNKISDRINDTINRLRPGKPPLPFAVTHPYHDMLQLNAMLASTGSDTVGSITMSNNVINGVNTGNNYVYRLSLPKLN